VPLVFPVFIIFVSLFLCLVPVITAPSPRYFFALVLIGLGVAIYVPLVFYRLRPRWMGAYMDVGFPRCSPALNPSQIKPLLPKATKLSFANYAVHS
jgi:hypothetical protein